MSYQIQWDLQSDAGFNTRSRACLTEQGLVFKDSADAAFKALANAILRGDSPEITSSFVTILAGSPGFAEIAGDEDGGPVHSDAITDEMLLSNTQTQWPSVAALWFDAEGNPLP
jgi:hypothetical protein